MLKHVPVATKESAHVMKSQVVCAACGNSRVLTVGT